MALFTAITILQNTFAIVQKIFNPINDFIGSLDFYPEKFIDHMGLFNIRVSISASSDSLTLPALLLVFLSILVPPYIQYLINVGRSHEIGALRASGMSKGRVWLKLFLENIVLISASLAVTQIIVLFLHKRLALALLPIDVYLIEQINSNEVFSDVSNLFSYNWQVSLYTFVIAVIMTLITAGLCYMLISRVKSDI